MKLYLSALSISLFLISCVSMESQIDSYIKSETVVVKPLEDGNYLVKVMNRYDFNWNGNLKEDRERLLHFLFKDKCKYITILSESSEQTGESFVGPVIIYSYKIECRSNKDP